MYINAFYMRLPFRDAMDQLLFEMVLPNTLCSFERIGRDLVVHLCLEFKSEYDIVNIVKYKYLYLYRKRSNSLFTLLTYRSCINALLCVARREQILSIQSPCEGRYCYQEVDTLSIPCFLIW